MKKRLLSMLLAAVMVLTMLPSAAFAAEEATISLSFTAQAENSFLCPPQWDVEVTGTLAERYGYIDSVTDGVSALDVLVRAHEVIFGAAFSPEDAHTFLVVGETGFVTTLFGTATASNGFTINGAQPHDDSLIPSDYGDNYTGYTIDTAEVNDGDCVEFFLYQDESSLDHYVWFEQNGAKLDALAVTAGNAAALTLNGYCIGYYGCNTQEFIAQRTAAVEDAQLCLVDLGSGDCTDLSGAVTDEDGLVSVSFPSEGTYYLSAYITEEDMDVYYATPILLPLLEVSVSAASVPEPDAMSDAEAIETLYAEFSDKKYNAASTTPLIFPYEYEGVTYTNIFTYLDAWARNETGREMTLDYEIYDGSTAVETWSSGSKDTVAYTAIDNKGEITPAYYKDNAVAGGALKNVIFTVGEESSGKINYIRLTVGSQIRTPEEIIAYIITNLPFDRIKGKNTSPDGITQPVGETGATGTVGALPMSDKLYTSKSATIAWKLENVSGSKAALVLASNKTTVLRPNVGEPDGVFQLTATVTHKTETAVQDTAVFDLSVPAFEEVVVPIRVTEGAALALTDSYYKAAVAEPYLVKQDGAPEGYDLYLCSLHTGVTGAAQSFDYAVSKDGCVTKTGKVSVTGPGMDTTVLDLVASSEEDTKLSYLTLLAPTAESADVAAMFEFDPDVFDYTLDVTGVQSIKLTAGAMVEGAKAYITSSYSSLANANKGTLNTTNRAISANGTLCYLPDAAGSSDIVFTVNAPAGSTQETLARTYTIHVNKKEASRPLTAIALTASSSGGGTKGSLPGADAEEVLSPAFVAGGSDTLYYTVNYFRDQVTVKPIAAGSTITVNGAAVDSGKISGVIPLEVGDNTITIRTVKDAVTTDYSVMVRRKAELRIAEFTLPGGTRSKPLAEDGSNWVSSGTFASNATSIFVTFQTNVTEGVRITIDGVAGDHAPGEAIEIPVGDAAAKLPNIYLSRDVNGVTERVKYVIGFYRNAAATPDAVESFLPAPGQFVNQLVYLDAAKTLTGATSASLITLGAFGGNIVYRYDEPVANDPNHPYGIDFIVSGNVFRNSDGSSAKGASEPAAVMVSQDGVTWYELAGSEHYMASTRHDVTVTYQNTDPAFLGAVDIPWSDSDGESGILPKNDFHSQPYFPNPALYAPHQTGIGSNAGYTASEVSFTGTMIAKTVFPAFGYGDTHAIADDFSKADRAVNPYAKNDTKLTNGDGFDISWAVDASGDPVTLDSVTYIKLYNAKLAYGDATGEVSPEIKTVLRAAANADAVGESGGLTSLAINGEAVALSDGTYSYTVDAKGATSLAVIPEAKSADANIYVSNQYVNSGAESSKIAAVSKLRIIVQEGTKEPAIYLISFTNVAGAHDNADLIGVTLTPGDETKSPDAQNKLAFSVGKNVSSIKLNAEPASTTATLNLRGGQLTEALDVTGGVATEALELRVGETVFTLTVTSASNQSTQEFTVVVTRAAPSAPAENDIQVTFALTGDKVHYDKTTQSNTGRHTNPTWISSASVSVPEGSTVKYVTELMLNNAKLPYVSNGIYISSINGLAEFDNGPNSGWMYRHNTDIANEGYAARVLSDGDTIKWFYTDDYTTETGYEPGDWQDSDTSPKDTLVSKEVAVTAQTDAGGKATAVADSGDIAAALSSAVKSAGGNLAEVQVVVALAKDAASLETTLEQAAVKSLADAGHVQLTIESGLGAMTFDHDALAGLVKGAGAQDDVVFTMTHVDESALSDRVRTAVGDHTAFALGVTVGGTEKRDFDGVVTVFLPYALPSGVKAEALTVYQLGEDGALEQRIGVQYDAARKGYGFTTDSLSLFMVAPVGLDTGLPFGDVQGHWAYQAMQYVYDEGLMAGIGADQFDPDGNTTRAMLVTVLYRCAGEPSVATGSTFTDVPSGQWYTDAVCWASGHGIVTGYGNGIFGAEDEITREQLATILMRYAAWSKLETGSGNELSAYTDADQTSDWALDALEWANAQALITGTTATTLDPGGTATRAQAATVLMRFAEGYAD